MLRIKQSFEPSAAKTVSRHHSPKDRDQAVLTVVSPIVGEEPEAPAFLTEKQLAARHQKSVKTIRNLRVTGGYIPYVKIGRHVRYRLEDVLFYERSNMKRSTSDDGGEHA